MVRQSALLELFDGSNWKSELLHSEEECANDNRQYDLLDSNDDTAKEVIAAYDRAEDVPRQWEMDILHSLMKKLGMRLDSLNGTDTQVWQTFIKFITL